MLTLEAYQPYRIGIRLECSIGELFARTAFMPHDNQEHTALNQYAALKGLAGDNHQRHGLMGLMPINGSHIPTEGSHAQMREGHLKNTP